jgi:hypothetical protein
MILLTMYAVNLISSTLFLPQYYKENITLHPQAKKWKTPTLAYPLVKSNFNQQATLFKATTDLDIHERSWILNSR